MWFFREICRKIAFMLEIAAFLESFTQYCLCRAFSSGNWCVDLFLCRSQKNRNKCVEITSEDRRAHGHAEEDHCNAIGRTCNEPLSLR